MKIFLKEPENSYIEAQEKYEHSIGEWEHNNGRWVKDAQFVTGEKNENLGEVFIPNSNIIFVQSMSNYSIKL